LENIFTSSSVLASLQSLGEAKMVNWPYKEEVRFLQREEESNFLFSFAVQRTEYSVNCESGEDAD
jgi:hypothetical protein